MKKYLNSETYAKIHCDSILYVCNRTKLTLIVKKKFRSYLYVKYEVETSFVYS